MYIQDPKGENGGVLYGFGLVILYVFIDIFSTLIAENFNFMQLILGVKAKYAIVAIIYDKVFALSSATNK